MGLFSKLTRRPRKYRDLVEALFRERNDQRLISWTEMELCVHTHMTLEETRVDLQEEFETWQNTGDIDTTRSLLQDAIEEGATTAPGYLAIPTVAANESRADVIAPGLALALCFVEPHEEALFLTEEELANRKQTFDEVRSLVAGEVLELDHVFEPIDSDTRLLTPVVPVGSILAALPQLTLPPLDGDPIVVILDSLKMLVFGEHDKQAQAAASGLLREFLQGRESVLGLCYVLRKGKLIPWLPPRSDESDRILFIALRRAGHETAYAQQKKVLQGETPFFMATYNVERKEGLPLVSMASWATGVKALLPRADILAISVSLTDHRAVPFDLALEKFPELFVRLPKLLPPLYHVNEVPSVEALDALGKHSPDPLAYFDVEESQVQIP